MLELSTLKKDQVLIAFSGRKGAGKNTIASFLRSYFAEKCLLGYLRTDDPHLIESLAGDHVLECSFADNLKEFCIDTLGLSYGQCYGTDKEKNTPTEYDWENSPRFLRWKFGDVFGKQMVAEGQTQDMLMSVFHQKLFNPVSGGHPNMSYMTGKMTGREIMQIVGTDLNRQTFGNIWAAATIRRIKKRGRPLSLITDNRFPNEIQAVLDQPRGYIIRLTRSPFGQADVHPSESALDGYDWNKPKCFVLDNAKMTIEEQNEAVKPMFHQILGA